MCVPVRKTNVVQNSLTKWITRFSVSTLIVVVVLLSIALSALAAPASVTNFSGRATDTSIFLLWTPATSSNSTVIRVSTSSFPTSPAGGTAVYSGTGFYATYTATSGYTYYFAAWGYDGSNYSSESATLVITTTGSTSANTTAPIDRPTLPTEVLQDPDTSGWNIHPIDDIVNYFASSGLGMPTDNLWMTISSIFITLMGLVTYVKWRNFFASYALVFLACSLAVGIGVMQGLVLVILLIIGAGVFAVERYYQ